MKPPIPVLRIFDVAKAKEFYVDFLGFQLDWEHRFEEHAPWYGQVSRGDCVLQLSEHYGDSTPGTRVRVETPDIDAYLDGLRAARHKFCRPGSAEMQPWGLREIDLTDPFGNRISLYSAAI